MAIVRNKRKKEDAPIKQGRRAVTEALTRAATYYLTHKMFSCHVELGIERWGKYRLDILALNTKGHMIRIPEKA